MIIGAMGGESPSEDPEVLFQKELDLNSDFTVPVQIAEIVANASGQRMSELDPLYYHIDGDALGDILDSESEVHVSFRYEGFGVEIHGQEQIEIFLVDD